MTSRPDTDRCADCEAPDAEIAFWLYRISERAEHGAGYVSLDDVITKRMTARPVCEECEAAARKRGEPVITTFAKRDLR